MLFYGLTADRVKRIIRNPKRIENGVAENTMAAMVLAGTKQRPSEIWVMYTAAKPRVKSLKLQDQSSGRKIIISAWRYPGVSPVGKQIPIPTDILEELNRTYALEPRSPKF